MTKRGSTAFMTRSTLWRRASSATAALSPASMRSTGRRVGVAQLALQRLGALGVVVGEHHLLAPVALRRHPGDRLANRAYANQQNPHAAGRLLDGKGRVHPHRVMRLGLAVLRHDHVADRT